MKRFGSAFLAAGFSDHTLLLQMRSTKFDRWTSIPRTEKSQPLKSWTNRSLQWDYAKTNDSALKIDQGALGCELRPTIAYSHLMMTLDPGLWYMWVSRKDLLAANNTQYLLSTSVTGPLVGPGPQSLLINQLYPTKHRSDHGCSSSCVG